MSWPAVSGCLQSLWSWLLKSQSCRLKDQSVGPWQVYSPTSWWVVACGHKVKLVTKRYSIWVLHQKPLCGCFGCWQIAAVMKENPRQLLTKQKRNSEQWDANWNWMLCLLKQNSFGSKAHLWLWRWTFSICGLCRTFSQLLCRLTSSSQIMQMMGNYDKSNQKEVSDPLCN